MVNQNNFRKYGLGQTIDLKYLFKTNENVTSTPYRVTIQDALKEANLTKEPTEKKDKITKKIYKTIPSVKGNGRGKEDKEQSIREERELARKQEVERIEKLSTYGEEQDIMQDIKAGYLPVREAIILSEIIGAPRSKSRYGRRRS